MTAPPRPAGGQPLALRLALLLAAAVAVVLLVAGLLVNRAVSGSLKEALNERQRAGIEFAATLLEDALERDGPIPRRAVQEVLRRIANQAGGVVVLRDAGGEVVAEAGRLPPNIQVDELDQPLPGGAGTLEIRAPARGEPFLRSFNAALLVAGLLSVLVLLVVAVLAADRLTRPLRGVAVAARRLGAGDLSVRAAGGPDLESRELASAFNGMAQRLERSEMLRRRAASDIAHDLATPATVLESQLQAMLDGVVPADREQLEKARAAAGSLSGVILQLGELAGAESAALQRRPERLDVAEVVTEVAGSLDSLFRERGVRLELELPRGPVETAIDRGHFSRALRNVVTNAAQHTRREGSVTVQLTSVPGLHQLRVVDEGRGIAPEDVPHVFERFYRADRSRRSERAGSGIGLTIARELLSANGATIDVERTGPDGTSFLISLPAA